MPKILNLVGQKFGKLNVKKSLGIIKKRTWFLCKCQCGRFVNLPGARLKKGQKSCGSTGCKPGTKHGLSKKSIAYNRWRTMIKRCYSKTAISYPHYGGIGIKVCRRWRKSFLNFLNDIGEPPAGHVLDRNKNNGNYTPSNCSWVTYKQSTENRGNTIWCGGKRVAQLAKEIGIPESRVYSRLRYGWTVKEIRECPEAWP